MHDKIKNPGGKWDARALNQRPLTGPGPNEVKQGEYK